MVSKWWPRGNRQEPVAPAGAASSADRPGATPESSGVTGARAASAARPGPAQPPGALLPAQTSADAPATDGTPALQHEQGYEYQELPTSAPRTGQLASLPVPRLTDVPTSLPGMRADGGVLRGCWIAAASMTGTSHLVHGTSGQDVYRYTVTKDGSGLILVVCDGLGSRPATAQTGAELLASYLCEAASHITGRQMALAPQDVLRDVLAAGSVAVQRHRVAVLGSLTDSDLASTVAVCWLPLPADDDEAAGDGVQGTDPGGESAGSGQGHAVRVGDCNVFTLSSGRYETAFPADEGPANLVTGYLPDDDAHRLAEYAPVVLDGVEAVILTTDGLAIDLFDSPSVRTWLASCWSVPCSAARMLDSLRYRRQGSHDDRTALVAWPTASASAPPASETRVPGQADPSAAHPRPKP